ncbi:unnamed protein product [Macrosiphum euphorbiae]|uniref:Uncharacterized protein n=1 Tax=Macrosiphum euphorbiae TaxID=13131 RepID=A0AAV0WWP2_9HEMI|nr:unnamed protein product [Macrosiphum euphorbiae]
MSFKFLNTFEVQRHIMNSSERSTFLQHGFSDSSEKAYAAVVYIVSTQEHSVPTLLAENYENSTFNIEERTVQCSMSLTTTSSTSPSLQLMNRHSNLER